MEKRRWVKLRVPASTANLGAGFDALGMALGLYNEIELERTGSGMRLEIEGEGADRLQALGTQNLVARAVTATLTYLGDPSDGLRVRMINRIPLSRGLGSSSAAVLGGAAAAAALAGASLILGSTARSRLAAGRSSGQHRAGAAGRPDGGDAGGGKGALRQAAGSRSRCRSLP